jgi:hypothetical protein
MGLLPSGGAGESRRLNKGGDEVQDAELIQEGEEEQSR